MHRLKVTCQNAATETCISNFLLVQYLLRSTIQNGFAQSEENIAPYTGAACLKKQQLQQTIWVYPSSCHKDAQYPQFAAWKTTATAAIPSSGAGLGMAGESHSLKVSQV